MFKFLQYSVVLKVVSEDQDLEVGNIGLQVAVADQSLMEPYLEVVALVVKVVNLLDLMLVVAMVLLPMVKMDMKTLVVEEVDLKEDIQMTTGIKVVEVVLVLLLFHTHHKDLCHT